MSPAYIFSAPTSRAPGPCRPRDAMRPLPWLVLSCLFLGACSTIPWRLGTSAPPEIIAPPELAAPAPETETIVPDEGGQSETGPALETRLDQLEEDVAGLRIALSRIEPALQGLLATATKTDTASAAKPAQTARPAVETTASPQQPNVKAPEPAGTAEKLLPGRVFAVHLASYRDRNLAKISWRDLVQKQPRLLGELTPVLARVELPGKGTFYRLKAGPFATRRAADAVCVTLIAENWACSVLDFTGERFGGESATTAAGG